MYDVYLDDIYFYGVKTFNKLSDRKIIVYNGIGTGYFPKADDPDLKKWSWECQLQEFPEHYHNEQFAPASQILKKLDAIANSRQPVRLVMKSEFDSISVMVLLESYPFKEQYAGVYNVSVNVTEHKDAAVLTTNIPEIPRPGKIPVPPPSPVKKDETSFDKTNKAPNSWETKRPPGKGAGPGGDSFLDPQTGNEIHLPVDPKPNKDYGIIDRTKENYYVSNVTGELVKAHGINWGYIRDKIFPDYKDSALGRITQAYEGFKDGFAGKSGKF